MTYYTSVLLDARAFFNHRRWSTLDDGPPSDGLGVKLVCLARPGGRERFCAIQHVRLLQMGFGFGLSWGFFATSGLGAATVLSVGTSTMTVLWLAADFGDAAWDAWAWLR
jgi:hypothetical protein